MKKIILLLFTFHFSVFTLKAQGTWTQKASLPDTARGYGVGFSIDSMGYVGLGYSWDSNHSISDLWQFNTVNNIWLQKASFPGNGRVLPATFVIGHKAFVITGTSDPYATHCYKECWEYDATIDKWTRKADFPGVARAGAIGFSIGNKGYLGTGCDTNIIAYNDFWQYDTALDNWKQLNNFIGISRFDGNGFVVGGKGYLCFGTTSNIGNMLGDIWQYDTGTDTWIQKKNFPDTARYLAAGFIINNDIYIGTGQDIYGTCYKDFWKYNTLTDVWVQKANFLGRTRMLCSGFSIDNHGYLGIGEDSNIFDFNDLYEYIPDSLLTSNYNIASAINDIIVYPNPVNTIIYIKFPYPSDGLVNLSISDISGKVLINSELQIINSRLSLDLSSLSIGMYFLNIKNKKIIINKKFIKC